MSDLLQAQFRNLLQKTGDVDFNKIFDIAAQLTRAQYTIGYPVDNSAREIQSSFDSHVNHLCEMLIEMIDIAVETVEENDKNTESR